MTAARRVRVAQVITRFIVGGAQETVLLTAALADRERFEPIVVTGPQAGPEGSLREAAGDRGVRVVVLPELVREVHPARDLAAARALTRLLRELAPDVVHTHSSKAGLLGRRAARRAGVPRVLHTVHGWPFHCSQHPLVGQLWRTAERRTAPLADRLVVVAETDRAKGLAAGIGRPEQYVVVRSGLELATYGPDAVARDQVRDELGLPADSLAFVAVNRLSAQKDPLTLVRALATVLRSEPRTRLVVVGDGPLRAAAQAEAAGLGIASSTVFTGLRRDVPRLLAAMDIFVSASRWEGLPRTVLQAMATGLPVVATCADGVADVVRHRDTGLLAPVGNAAALGEQAASLAADPALGPALAERARHCLAEFDATRMVRRLEQLYAGGEA